MEAWGLIVLLISKVAGHGADISSVEQEKSTELLDSQLALADITEIIRISHLVHKGLFNLQPLMKAGSDLSLHIDKTVNIKKALLYGDYLLVNSMAGLAALRNQELFGLILSAVRDFSESEFIGDRDEQNNPLPSKPISRQKIEDTDTVDEDISDDIVLPVYRGSCLGMPEKEWTLRHVLSSGSLLAKSCQGTLKLAGQSDRVQRNGFLFGKDLSLAWQACLDLKPFLPHNSFIPGSQFNLISAPVLFHLQHDPALYVEIERGSVSIENIDYKKLHKEIMRGPGVEQTKQLQRKHSVAAMNILNEFPVSDARNALQNIILAMDHSILVNKNLFQFIIKFIKP